MLNLDTIDTDPTDELEEMIAGIKAQGHKVQVVDTVSKRAEPGVKVAGRSAGDRGDGNSLRRTCSASSKLPKPAGQDD